MQLGAVGSAAGVVGTWTSTQHLAGKIIPSELHLRYLPRMFAGDPSGTSGLSLGAFDLLTRETA